MARTQSPTPSEPGRFKQMWQVFQMTRRLDKAALWLMLVALVVPVALGIVLALTVSAGNILGMILWIVVGLMVGVLLFMLVLSRRAERAAYRQIAGQPGAVGAVLKGSLRRGWRATEMPIAVNRNQDAVYRAVGKGGIVLIAEGSTGRTERMLEDERRKVARIVPNVPVKLVHVGDDELSVPLHRLAGTLGRYKRVLNRAEIFQVSNRLTSLGQAPLPIPKGVDPMRMRPQRPR